MSYRKFPGRDGIRIGSRSFNTKYLKEIQHCSSKKFTLVIANTNASGTWELDEEIHVSKNSNPQDYAKLEHMFYECDTL